MTTNFYFDRQQSVLICFQKKKSLSLVNRPGPWNCHPWPRKWKRNQKTWSDSRMIWHGGAPLSLFPRLFLFHPNRGCLLMNEMAFQFSYFIFEREIKNAEFGNTYLLPLQGASFKRFQAYTREGEKQRKQTVEEQRGKAESEMQVIEISHVGRIFHYAGPMPPEHLLNPAINFQSTYSKTQQFWAPNCISCRTPWDRQMGIYAMPCLSDDLILPPWEYLAFLFWRGWAG